MQISVQNHRKTSFGKQASATTVDSRQNSTTKNRHAGATCIKKHSKIDDFPSKFEHQKIDTPVAFASKSTPKSMIFSWKFEHQKIDTHSTCVKTHAKIEGGQLTKSPQFHHESRFPLSESRFFVAESKFPSAESSFPVAESRFPVAESRFP